LVNGECPERITTCIVLEGDPLPPDDTVACCSTCGRPHFLIIREVVVEAGAENPGPGVFSGFSAGGTGGETEEIKDNTANKPGAKRAR
jgi:hypothetical protein